MQLSNDELSTYKEQGFLLLPHYFSDTEVAQLKAQLPDIFSREAPSRIMEKDGRTVRSVYGTHNENELMGRLVRLPRLVGPTMQLIEEEIYVHQFKINNKAAFAGDVWEWHQDYIFWLKEDGIPKPDMINVVVFLDQVNEFNGPLLLIPGSHRENVIDVPARLDTMQDTATNATWLSNLTADLKYSLDQPQLVCLVERYGIVSCNGPAGSVLFFHPNIIHGSSPNMSPFGRSIIIISYNSVKNTPIPVEKRRPEFLASRVYQPIKPLCDDTLNS